jgi:hypothetical protein
LAYTDDIDVMGWTVSSVNEAFFALSAAADSGTESK